MIAFMRKWHKYLGLLTAALVLMLSITGILLMHKKELGLNKIALGITVSGKPVPIEPWQTLVTPKNGVLLATKQGVFVKQDGQWRQTLAVTTKVLTEQDGTIYAATRSGLHRSADNGETWQQLLEGDIRQFLPTGVQSLMAISTTALWHNAGNGTWQKTVDFGKPLDVRSIAIQDNLLLITAKEGLFKVAGNKLQKEKLPKAAGQEPMDLQKLITDLHNGKLGGTLLITLVDLTALALIFLTFSGIWIWWVPRQKKKALIAAATR